MARSTPAQNPLGWARTTRMRCPLGCGRSERGGSFARALYAETAQRLVLLPLHGAGLPCCCAIATVARFLEHLGMAAVSDPQNYLEIDQSRLDPQFANPTHLCLVVPQRLGFPVKKSEDSSRGKNSRKRPIRATRRRLGREQ